MKIVIDIEEGRYNWIMSHASNDPRDYANTTDIVFRKAVESGTVLPKGHGRLVDADSLLAHIVDYGEGQNRLMLIDPYYVRNANAIIEADKETENE